MMTAIANVNSNFAELRFKYRMAGVALQIIRGFIEVTDTWYVILTVLSQIIAIVCDDNRCIPNGIAMDLVTFENRRYNDHIVLARQL